MSLCQLKIFQEMSNYTINTTEKICLRKFGWKVATETDRTLIQSWVFGKNLRAFSPKEIVQLGILMADALKKSFSITIEPTENVSHH